jgi:hypothetical protein
MHQEEKKMFHVLASLIVQYGLDLVSQAIDLEHPQAAIASIINRFKEINHLTEVPSLTVSSTQGQPLPDRDALNLLLAEAQLHNQLIVELAIADRVTESRTQRPSASVQSSLAPFLSELRVQADYLRVLGENYLKGYFPALRIKAT